MTLVASLVAVDTSKTGNLKWIARDITTLTGLQEIQPGWIFCNGAAIPSSGLSPAGVPYAPLYAYLATKFGITNGMTPDFREGKQMIPKGATLFTTVGASVGAITVALAASHIPDHVHGSIGRWPGPPNTYGQYNGSGASPVNVAMQTANPNGASATAHNNMPPYTVVGGVLIRL